MCIGGTCMGCRTAIGQNDMVFHSALLRRYTQTEALLICSLLDPRYVCCAQQMTTSVHNDDYALALAPSTKRNVVEQIRQSHPDIPVPQSLAESMGK